MIAELFVGQQIGAYHIESILGRGGMAVVYKAHQSSGPDVALKLLFLPPGGAAEIQARFKREADIASKLRHPNIVRVLETGQIDNQPFLTMPVVEGQTLAQRLGHSGALPEDIAADIAWQIADALDYAHRQGVVHRDVKPSNIMLAGTGQAMLTDFGIALALDDVALTRTGHTIGTAAYMAPEQADGSRMVDGRADLYSLGIVLYQMVTGQAPFQGTTPQVLHAQLYSAPPPPTKKAPISPALEAIILRALEKEPNERYQTGAALAQALATVGETPSIHPTAVAAPASKAPSRWLKGAMVLGLLLLIGWAAVAGWQWISPQITTPPTQSLTATGEQPGRALIAAATPVTATEIVPTPTPVAVVPVTVLPSATPTPLPKVTPQPTSTELPLPTQSPTLLPTPAPTLSPTPTPCPQPVAAEFLPLLADGLNGQQLGCPKSSERTIATAWQPFERGEMLWHGDANLIYILQADNTWRSIGDTWRDGDPDFDPAIVPPDGRLQPVRGFGKVWREQQGIQETLGWAAAEELGGDGNIQEFSAGMMWYIPALERFFILFNDGTYALISQ